MYDYAEGIEFEKYPSNVGTSASLCSKERGKIHYGCVGNIQGYISDRPKESIRIVR